MKFNNDLVKAGRFFLASLLILFFSSARAQEQAINVGIFLYDNVELLDFAGPAEVFAATSGFNVYSITADGNPVECNKTGSILNKITPDYGMENSPVPDIIVFPGGGTGPTSKDQKVLEWVKERAGKGSFILTVCTGASVLANTGLLTGKNITTWYGFIPTLQSQHPELTVLENTRFVDNGMFLTTAGVSAGIDGALHLVARIKGSDVAAATARYMEYDKWDPHAGRVDSESAYLTQMRTYLAGNRKQPFVAEPGTPIPYEGDLRSLASDFTAKDQKEEAAFILEQCIRLVPSSAAAKSDLASVYKALGRPAPVLENEEAIATMIRAGKLDAAVSQYEEDQKQFPGWVSVRHGGKLTRLGIEFYEKNDKKTALAIFKLIARADPGYGSYYNVGEVEAGLGNNTEAIANYQKSLSFNPGDAEVMRILSELEKKNN